LIEKIGFAELSENLPWKIGIFMPDFLCLQSEPVRVGDQSSFACLWDVSAPRGADTGTPGKLITAEMTADDPPVAGTLSYQRPRPYLVICEIVMPRTAIIRLEWWRRKSTT